MRLYNPLLYVWCILALLILPQVSLLYMYISKLPHNCVFCSTYTYLHTQSGWHRDIFSTIPHFCFCIMFFVSSQVLAMNWLGNLTNQYCWLSLIPSDVLASFLSLKEPVDVQYMYMTREEIAGLVLKACYSLFVHVTGLYIQCTCVYVDHCMQCLYNLMFYLLFLCLCAI